MAARAAQRRCPAAARAPSQASRGLRGALLLAASWLGLAAAAPAAEPAPYILAVQPYLSAPEIERRFSPLAEYLGKQLGRPVRVRVGSNYEEHISYVGQDAVDIAYIGPAPYVSVVERFGPKPILARIETNGRPELRGVIFVRQDSSIERIADLKGKRFAFGDPESTMGSIMPRYVLRQNGVALEDLARVSHVLSHDNVVLGVLAGDFDAGVVRADVYDEMAGRGLRRIADLPPVSEHVFVTRANLPPEEVRRLRQALLQLRSVPDGPLILRSLGAQVTGMVPARDADYDELRKVVRALARAGR